MEHTFFNLKNALSFYQKTWETYPTSEDDSVPLSEDAFMLQFQEQIAEIERSKNKFGLLFHIHHPTCTNERLQIKKWMKLQRLTDAGHVSFENFLEAIHPQFFQTYLHHAHAAYKAMLKVFAISGTSNLGPIQFTVRIPVRRTFPDGKKEYWWMYQTSHPAKLLPDSVVASHLNVYEIKGPFKGNTTEPYIYPAVIRKPDFREHTAFAKLFVDAFKEAFLEVCSEHERKIIEGLMNEFSREGIAKSIGIKEGYLNKILIGQILKKVNPEYPLFPYQEFPRLEGKKGLISYLKGYSPFG